MKTRPRWAIAACLALGGLACNAIFGDSSQCASDDDCGGVGTNLMCGTEGTCVARDNGPGPTTPGNDAGAKVDATTTDAPAGNAGVLAKIILSPLTASLLPNASQQFFAVGQDALGAAPNVAPMYTWSVSGGGTMSDAGLFKAGAAAGGPFVVTVTSGSINATAQVTVTTAPVVDVKIGETNILANDDSMNLDKVLAQEATLAQAATLKSLSFYVVTAVGKVRFGVYDATGPGGGPGAKKAETAEVDATALWMTVPVVNQVLLPAGNYWLAYTPSDNGLVFRLSGDADGKLAYFDQAYAALPDTFSVTPTNEAKHWSFYATLTR